MKPLRTRFSGDIVTEFLPPTRALAGKPARVIILCKGGPGMPQSNETMEFWSRKGFWVFFPRYRGTWESDGEFLKESPERDILDLIDQLPKGFTELWSGTTQKVQPTQLYIFGGSFGGAAAILCSRDPRVTKAVAFASIIDWSKDTTMERIERYTREAFGNGYRFSTQNWQKLGSGTFYNPAHKIASVVGSKLLFVHAKDDLIAPFALAKQFAKETGAQFIGLRTGGHFGYLRSIEPAIYKRIRWFMQS